MTKEEKELLLKDICARLPYNPYILIEGERRTVLSSVTTYQDEYAEIWYEGIYYDIKDCKPYLRPMSSMTEEEKEELKEEHKKDERIYVEVIERIANGDEDARGTAVPHFAADWCNKNHFDYRGLIEKGLALEAPEGMYKIE